MRAIGLQCRWLWYMEFVVPSKFRGHGFDLMIQIGCSQFVVTEWVDIVALIEARRAVGPGFMM